MESRDVICDSGVLISLTAGCLDGVLDFFAQKYKVRFIIPPSVEYECVTYPLERNIRKYLFSSLRIQRAISDGIVVKVDAGISENAKQLMSIANTTFFARGEPLKLIEAGESEVLVLANELQVDYVLVDERTTRVLIESPLSLKTHLEEEFHVNIMVNRSNLTQLASRISKLQLLRSSELVVLAYEKGYFQHFEEVQMHALEAALYKLRTSGCSISYAEIAEYMQSVR